MKVLFSSLFFALTASTATASSVCTDGWDILQLYALFSAGNVSTTADVDGKAFIGGNLTSTLSANFGVGLSSTADVTLEIAGEVTAGSTVNVKKGSLGYCPDDGFDLLGRVFLFTDGLFFGAEATVDADICLRLPSLEVAIQDLSLFLLGLQVTVDVSLPGPHDEALGLVVDIDAVDEGNVAVLSVDGQLLFDNDKVLQLDIQNTIGADLIVINVGGKIINWNHCNLLGDLLLSVTGRSKVIWNFYEATSIDLNANIMLGIVVAPFAHVKTEAIIAGAVAVGSLETTAELQVPLLSVACPYTVAPSPTTEATTEATTTTAATTTTTKKDSGAGGDPHIQLWGGDHISFHGECDLVLLHAPDFLNKGLDLHIRTTIEHYFSYIETAALRVGDNTLQFYKDHVLVNGDSVYHQDLPATIGNDFVVSMYKIDAGKNLHYHKNYKVDLVGAQASIIFKFYKNFLTINVMSDAADAEFETSTGLLGHYHTGEMLSRDGATMKDPIAYGMEWQVIPGEDVTETLFTDNRSPQLPFEGCRMPTAARPVRRMLRGPEKALFAAAKMACANAAEVDLCIEDCMATGDIGLAALW